MMKNSFLTAIFFVAFVGALRFSRANETTWDASSIFALKLVAPAGHVFTHGHVLVGTIGTIFVSIAYPRTMNTSYPIFTFKFSSQAVADWLDVLRTVLLIKKKLIKYFLYNSF